jgi:hypothetical protein
MECFVATDFDNNSQLITLSAIILSILHSMYIQQDAHFTEFILSDNCSKYFWRHHHPSQEHKTTVTTASGNRYTVMLSAESMEGLEKIWVFCVWRSAPTKDSKQFQNFHDSSRKQYDVTVTRCCSYICFVLLKIGDGDARIL